MEIKGKGAWAEERMAEGGLPPTGSPGKWRKRGFPRDGDPWEVAKMGFARGIPLAFRLVTLRGRLSPGFLSRRPMWQAFPLLIVSSPFVAGHFPGLPPGSPGRTPETILVHMHDPG